MRLDNRVIALPKLKREKKIPNILNQKELKKIFAATKLFRHRVLLMLIYSAGLRSSEIINLKISDIDFVRKTIYIRQSKYKKDRIVPLSKYISHELKKYLKIYKPNEWLFNGINSNCPYSKTGITWVLNDAVKRAKIQKKVSLHVIRHSYATHLLEEGVNIVTLKELLGHSDIETTMIYLHVAQCDVIRAHSPLDTLYIKKT